MRIDKSRKSPLLLLVANWKMNMTIQESSELVGGISDNYPDSSCISVVVCPSFICLESVSSLLMSDPMSLGAQNLHWENQGSFTGEVSGAMLKSVGCEYVIIGHSERRQYFGETDEMVAKKMRMAFSNDLIPILCCGESESDRDAKIHYDVIARQLNAVLNTVENNQFVIAYEPIWAIGTGKTASSEIAQDMLHFIRTQVLAKRFSPDVAKSTRILYGGSLNKNNAEDLFNQPDIDGGLIGGASLKVDEFLAMIDAQYIRN